MYSMIAARGTARTSPQQQRPLRSLLQCRPPSNAQDVSARDGNRGNGRSHHSQSRFRDGHGYNEADSGEGDGGRRHEERGKGRSQAPQDDQPNRRDAGGQPKQNNVFNRLGGSEQRRREEDLRDILNDRRERHGENVPPATEATAIPAAVQAQIDALNQAVQQLVRGRTSYIDHDRRKGTLFVQRIANAETPSKFKMPTLPNFDGYGDPVSHVNKFEIQMDIQKVSEDARCRIFPATLSEAAQEWFFKFPPASIVSWEMFVREFYGQFYAGRVHPTEANQLVEIRQQDGESLKDYIQRFMRVAAGAKMVGDEGKMMAITAGVKRRSPLWKSLRKDGVRTTQEFLDRADRYIKLEEAIADDGKPSGKDKKAAEPAKVANGSKPNGNGKGNGNGNSNGKNGGKRPHNEPSTSDNKRAKGNRYEPRFTNYTALVESRGEVYQATSSSVPYKKTWPHSKGHFEKRHYQVLSLS